MTSHENRKQRREAERKARKLANKQPRNSPAPPAPSPEPSQTRSTTAAYLAEMRAKAARELDEEFGAEFMAQAREVSDRMARRFGLPVSSRRTADVARPEPRPSVNPGPEIPTPQTQCGTENPIPAPRPISHNRDSPENGISTTKAIRQNRNSSENNLSTTIPVGQNPQHAPGNSLSASSPWGHDPASPSDPKIPSRSTGPRTPEGKLASSRNSLKHGLAAAVPVIPGEDPAAFETLRASLLHEHQPADATEQILVHQLAQSYWLLQRALRFQNDCFTLAGIDNKIAVDEKRLALFLRYATTHERAFHKALNTLLRLKRDRQKADLAAARAVTHGFVSQTTVSKEFVSQKQAPPPFESSPAGFVSQSDALSELDFAPITEITSRKSTAELSKLPDAA